MFRKKFSVFIYMLQTTSVFKSEPKLIKDQVCNNPELMGLYINIYNCVINYIILII